jgi:hypothetical protein
MNSTDIHCTETRLPSSSVSLCWSSRLCFSIPLLVYREPPSSVSTVAGTDWATGFWSPTETKYFFLYLLLLAGSGAHPASCTMGTGGSFPGGKARTGRDADHSPPSSAEVKKEQELYLLSPKAPPWSVTGQLYIYYKAKHWQFSATNNHICLQKWEALFTRTIPHSYPEFLKPDFTRSVSSASRIIVILTSLWCSWNVCDLPLSDKTE